MNPYILQIPLLDCKSDVPDEWELVAFELKVTLWDDGKCPFILKCFMKRNNVTCMETHLHTQK